VDAAQIISQAAQKARLAGRTLVASTNEARRDALLAIASELTTQTERILAANSLDMARAKSSAMAQSMQDRLLLTSDRIAGMADGLRQVAHLPDPLGRILHQRTLPNGLELTQKTLPFGVVGMVYEARPNVTVDAAAILLKSGNSALLRGSSSAAASNLVLVEIMREVLATTSISPDAIQYIPSDDRSTVTALLHARGEVDLVIPRGSAELIRMVVDEATVPTIETGAGVCHVYIDDAADFEKAIAILINSKTDRPSVCNAAETLLVNEKIAKDFMPLALAALHSHGVVLHGDAATQAIAHEHQIPLTPATDENWSTEYNALEMNVGIVADVLAAVDHIQKYGTHHTEAIVTENEEHASQFIALSDCAAVMVNASTRFTDGEQMGFGAEIGISNQKLHARGPMGLEQMTTTTWIVRGNGQIR
jgi:glutamate-5-semialdehyde dehydrogenase